MTGRDPFRRRWQDLPDPPDIARTLRTGYPEAVAPVAESPRCPVCGAEAEVYVLVDGDVAGCDTCATLCLACWYAAEGEVVTCHAL